MREIKLRLYKKTENSYYKVDEVNLQQLSDYELEFDYTEVVEYTGLKDKNGKEIYEGDVVELEPLRKGEPICYPIIKFIDGSFEMTNQKGMVYARELKRQVTKIRVVGNIYENTTVMGGR